MKKLLAILISNTGAGTNLQAISDAISQNDLYANIRIVVSDSETAKGVERARKHNLPVYILKKTDDLTHLFTQVFPVDYIVLSGWKQFIPLEFIEAFPKRILNLHPGLIPDRMDEVVKNPDGTDALWNKGKLTDLAIKEFLQKPTTYAGSSIHFLTEEFDFGPVLGRVFEKIEKNDTIDTLYKRLKKKENRLYVEVLQKMCNEDDDI